MCNILFLGGAKRVSMARYLKKAARELGTECQIYSYELDKHVPISIEGKVIIGRKWRDPGLMEDLIDNIRRYDISIVVPFVDGAVEIAAALAQSSEVKVFAPTSSPQLCAIMFDKIAAAEAFAKAGLPIPATYTGGEITHPLIAKPRFGSASKGVVTIHSTVDIAELEDTDKYLIQERIVHFDEYTVDCYVSVSTGEPRAIVPRKRIEVSGGEVTRTATVIFPEVHDLAADTIKKLNLRGAVTIQILHDLDTNRFLLMEINPRLGGGAVCSVLAGVDFPSLIIRESLGQPTEFTCYRPYTEIIRYPQEIVFYN